MPLSRRYNPEHPPGENCSFGVDLSFVVPPGVGLASGSLAILRVPDAPSLGIVYLEALSGGVYLESQADVARYVRAFALLRAAALDAADSLRLLRSLSG